VSVLVAIPYRTETDRRLVDRSRELAQNLTYPDIEIAHHCNNYGYSSDYSSNAKARNETIEQWLRDCHTDVLWIDVDVIDYPKDLVELLLAHRERTGAAIVAPMNVVKRPDLDHDIWYDTYFEQDGKTCNNLPIPPFDAERDLECCGMCVLMPADNFRRGSRFAPHTTRMSVGSWTRHGLTFDRVEDEFYSVMEWARAHGQRIRCCTGATVRHAWLPDYGMDWKI